MIMLISKIGTLTKSRIGPGRVTFSIKEPMRGQHVFLIAKYSNLYERFLFQLLVLQFQPFISLK